MEIKNILNYQWITIKRYKIYYIYIFIVYFILAFFDLKNKIYISEVSEYIYRYNFQQVCIVFSSIFVVSLLINEDFLKLFGDFISLYIRDVKKYFYSTFILLSLVNIVPFILGQTLSLFVNYLYYGNIPIILFLVNILIVSMEIEISILLTMTLSLVLKKNVLVYLLYFITITILLVVSNVYISIPLNISILEDEAYYITFDLPLWIGRIILMAICGILFHFAIKKIVDKKY
jgi:hypothetical protein